jgi:uncharacterized membrane protein
MALLQGANMHSKELKEAHRAVRDGQPQSSSVRVHRAISWLARAEAETDDDDARFIFLWIALNAAYAKEFGFQQAERDQLRDFIHELLAHDEQNRLHSILFEQFTGPIRTLIDNKFVFEPFWRALREHDSSGRWEEQFKASQRLALRALMERQTDVLLSIVLDRLYVLRNQLVHGGATWSSSANRAQVRDGTSILSALIPAVILLILSSDAIDLGEVAFPFVTP